MTIPMLKRLLSLVLLPVVSWSSHITFDLVSRTGDLDSGTLAAFPTTAGGSNTYYDDVAIRSGAGIRPPAVTALETTGCASGRPAGPGLHASTIYLIKMLDLSPCSGVSTSTAAIDFTADNRRRLLSVDGGAPYTVQFANAKNSAVVRRLSQWKDGSGMELMDPDAPAVKWLRVSSSQSNVAGMDLTGWNGPIGEPLALCLIGVIAMMPSVLRRRGEAGGRRRSGRRRRSHPERGIT